MALISPDFDAFFARVIRAVAPYLGDLVIAGGCANALYRHHPLALPTPIPGPGTKDLDLAFGPAPLSTLDRPPLIDLLREAGLESRLFGTAHPPVMKFVIAGAGAGPEVELLCPLVGARKPRRGEEPGAIALQKGGVTAQPLRYLDLLLFEPWEIDLPSVAGFEDMAGIPSLRLPHPLTYVMQKVLARDEWGRDPMKIEKDCYYTYEVAVVFRNTLAHLATILPRLRGAFPTPWVDRFAVRVARAAALGARDATPVTEAMVHASVLRLVEAVRTGLA
jgi:hypothetical protein